MYKLRKATKNGFGTKTESSEKRQKGVYLSKRHWKFLDNLAEKSGKSRNQVLRDIIGCYISDEKPELLEEGNSIESENL
jgi:metal-responsive CopG/Arc/MetJ family transcriptional regulator